jgi:hypothetical protein
MPFFFWLPKRSFSVMMTNMQSIRFAPSVKQSTAN